MNKAMNTAWMNEPLSPHGRDRRERGLAELLPIVRARPRRRVLGTAAACAVPLFALSMVMAWRTLGAAPTFIAHAAPPVASERGALAFVSFVRTDPTIVETIGSRGSGAVVRLDDSDLRSALAAAGRANGLVRIGGKVLLAEEVSGGGE